MTLTTALRRASWAAAGFVPGTVAWHAGLLAIAAIALVGLQRLGMEWQRRKTFVVLTRSAPTGTVIKQQDTAGRWSMHVTVGPGPGPGSRSPGSDQTGGHR